MDEGAAAVSSREGGAGVGVVTNVSGIETKQWEPQQFGKSQNPLWHYYCYHLPPSPSLPPPPSLPSLSAFIGYSRNLMAQFRRERDAKITQTAAETNRLIIRVERVRETVGGTLG